MLRTDIPEVEESLDLPSPSLERQDTIPFVDEDIPEGLEEPEEPEEPKEYFFYHSAHGNLDLEYPLVRKGSNPHPLGWPVVGAIDPDKTITILIKTNSIMGSSTLSSQTTLTGDFGLDFVAKEKRFKDYLKIVIHNRQIVSIDVLDPPPPPTRGDLVSRGVEEHHKNKASGYHFTMLKIENQSIYQMSVLVMIQRKMQDFIVASYNLTKFLLRKVILNQSIYLIMLVKLRMEKMIGYLDPS